MDVFKAINWPETIWIFFRWKNFWY